MKHQSQIVLFQSPPEPCSYLSDHIARNVYADPFRTPTMEMYNQLIQKGFRRSGHHIYRPYCDACQACVSVRIPVANFCASRSQKRARQKNQDLTLHVTKARFTSECFELYQRYLAARHKDGGMDKPNRQDFERFLFSDWSETAFVELRLVNQLVGVAVTDIVDTGLSAVYTYFDPDMASRSLGTAAIMMQIELAQSRKLPYLYLGYWISASNKMMYKSSFKPQQRYIDERWVADTDAH